MSTVKNKETKKRTPRTKESKEPIMRVGPKSEVLEKKIVDVYIPPQPCWNPMSVKNALDMHDRGNTQMTGRLSDSITRDTRVRACLNTLVFGILGLPFDWKWDMAEIGDGGSLSLKNVYTPTEEDKKYLEITKRWFEDFKSTSILGSIMTNVINMGFASMSKSWVLESDYKGSGEDLYIPECWVFHPSNVWYNTGTYEYYITTFEKGLLIVGDSNTDERVQIIKHANAERPWMEGVVRSVGLYYMDKWYALNDWRTYITNNSNPLRILETIREDSSRGIDDMSIEQLLIDIAKHQQLGLPLHLPEGHKLSLLTTNTLISADVFKKKVEHADTEIAIAYLGQNLTTEVNGGSHAAAKVHENVLHDRIRAYTKTLNSALNLLIKDFYRFNFPENVRVPIAYFNPEPEEDTSMKGEITKKKVDSLFILAQLLEKKPDLLNADELNALKKDIL